MICGIAKRNGHPISVLGVQQYGLIVTADDLCTIPYVSPCHFILPTPSATRVINDRGVPVQPGDIAVAIPGARGRPDREDARPAAQHQAIGSVVCRGDHRQRSARVPDSARSAVRPGSRCRCGRRARVSVRSRPGRDSHSRESPRESSFSGHREVDLSGLETGLLTAGQAPAAAVGEERGPGRGLSTMPRTVAALRQSQAGDLHGPALSCLKSTTRRSAEIGASGVTARCGHAASRCCGQPGVAAGAARSGRGRLGSAGEALPKKAVLGSAGRACCCSVSAPVDAEARPRRSSRN